MPSKNIINETTINIDHKASVEMTTNTKKQTTLYDIFECKTRQNKFGYETNYKKSMK